MVAAELTIFVTLVLHLSYADTECPDDVKISQGDVLLPDQRTIGSVLQYVCAPKTRASPVSWRVCRDDGSWSPIRGTATCVSYHCSGPITMENGWVSPRQARYQVGESVRFHCQPGYTLYGAPNVTCLPTGKWTAPPAVCDTGGTLCGNPGVPAGGQRVGHRFEMAQQVRYTCYRGLLMRGPRLRMCLEDGTWSGTLPECEGPHVYDDPQKVAEYFSLSEHALLNPEQELHLYFVIKASWSVGTENVETALAFMYRHANQVVDFSKKRSVEVVVFSSSAKRVNYDQEEGVSYDDYREFLNKSGVNTGEALQLVLRLIQQKLPTSAQGLPAKNIIILITDGRHNMGPSPSSVIQEMNDIIPNSDANLEIFVIGIGGASRRDGLDKIASQRAEPRAFYLPDYNELDEMQVRVSEDTCGVRGRMDSDFGRVFGGRPSVDHQWPWQALLMFNSKFIGGGSIIARRWILTAAHVVSPFMDIDPKLFSILAGVRQRPKHLDLTGVVKVEQCFIHKNFRPEDFYFDIALLRLKDELYFDHKKRPVCLPCTTGVSRVLSLPLQNWTSRCLHQDLILTGRGGADQRTITGFVSGWGSYSKQQVLASDLMYGKIFIKPREECDDISKTMAITLSDDKFCASGDGLDACKGDSGGPFVIKKNGRWIQIGIVSYGTSPICKNGTTGFYTSVPRLMPWIRETVGQDMNFA